MRRIEYLLASSGLLMGSLAACQSVAQSLDEEEALTLEYGCADVAVIGKFEILNHEPVSTTAPLPNWYSEKTLKLTVKDIVKGSFDGDVVMLTMTSHGEIRNDVDFLVVLHPGRDGLFELGAAAVWNEGPRPILKSSCRDFPVKLDGGSSDV